MPEWLNDLIVAIGGGTIVLVGILTIFKNLFIKLFETGIEASFEKNLEKYRNKLSRSTKAYEILLEKEFGYYNSLDPHLAILVPLVQDLVYYSDMSKEMELAFRQTRYKENLLKFIEMIPKIKNDVVLFQPYVPIQIFDRVSNLIGAMQHDLSVWSYAGKVIFGKNEGAIDLKKEEEISDIILLHVAAIESGIKSRLDQLIEQ